MKKYKNIPTGKAYKLLNTGSVILVCTKDKKGNSNIAPFAWQCPLEFEPVTQLLFICVLKHKTFDNISKNRQFVVCIPHAKHKKLVLDTGSVSGHKVDKIKKFGIKTFISPKLRIAVPDECIGFIECKLIKVIKNGETGIVMGEALSAKVDEKAFRDRILVEKPEGKTLHHLGGNVFCEPGKIIK